MRGRGAEEAPARLGVSLELCCFLMTKYVTSRGYHDRLVMEMCLAEQREHSNEDTGSGSRKGSRSDVLGGSRPPHSFCLHLLQDCGGEVHSPCQDGGSHREGNRPRFSPLSKEQLFLSLWGCLCCSLCTARVSEMSMRSSFLVQAPEWLPGGGKRMRALFLAQIPVQSGTV